MFERAAPKIYSSALSQEELQALFSAYAGATDSVAHAVTSKATLQQAKTQRKKAQQRSQQQAQGAAVVDVQDANYGAAVVEHQQQQAMEPWRLQPALEPQWLNFNSTGQIFCQPQDQARSSWDNLPPGNLPPCSNDEMAVQKAVQKAPS